MGRALDQLLQQLPAGVRGSSLFPDYLRYGRERGGACYFGSVVKTVADLVIDFDLYARQIRLALPPGRFPLFKHQRPMEASFITLNGRETRPRRVRLTRTKP